MRASVRQYHETLPYEGYPIVDLPRDLIQLSTPLGEAILKRTSALSLSPCTLTIETLATLLHYSYGILRNNQAAAFPTQFRAVPSAGGLYPLEIYFYSTKVQELEPGLYHYQPLNNAVRHIRKGDQINVIADALTQKELATGAALIIFLTALFERSTVKYGERGYRFILLEAGHSAQNLCLTACALGLEIVTIGGFLDRLVDEFLGLDGITHSTLYTIAIGKPS